MAERDAVVTGLDVAGVHLRSLGSACTGCETGCGGRCALFQDASTELVVPAPEDIRLAAGDRVRVCLDDRQLRRSAYAAYGLALVGLLAGASAGYGLARLAGLAADPLTLVGLVLGTWLAVRHSKRAVPVLRLELVDPAKHPQL